MNSDAPRRHLKVNLCVMHLVISPWVTVQRDPKITPKQDAVLPLLLVPWHSSARHFCCRNHTLWIQAAEKSVWLTRNISMLNFSRARICKFDCFSTFQVLYHVHYDTDLPSKIFLPYYSDKNVYRVTSSLDMRLAPWDKIHILYCKYGQNPWREMPNFWTNKSLVPFAQVSVLFTSSWTFKALFILQFGAFSPIFIIYVAENRGKVNQ